MAKKLSQVISASRRTDVPTCYYQELQSALKNEKIKIGNPNYPTLQKAIDLSPDKVHSLILWSKNFENVVNNLGYLENYNLYFQYTITGYSKVLEPNVPEYSDSIKMLEKLLKTFKPEQFNIRFDPIILSTVGEVVPNYEKPGNARLQVFDRLCKDLDTLGMNNCRLTTSFVTLYAHTKQALKAVEIDYYELSNAVQIKFMEKMVEIAQKYNRDIYTCANPLFDGMQGVKKGHCIDGELLSELFPKKCSLTKDKSQRTSCGCTTSIDIFEYTSCKNECAYCYVKNSKA